MPPTPADRPAHDQDGHEPGSRQAKPAIGPRPRGVTSPERLDAEAGQDGHRQTRQEERPGRDPEPVHPRDPVITEREKAESAAGGEHDRQRRQPDPGPDATTIRRPGRPHPGQEERDQADREHGLPVVLRAEIFRRSPQGEGVERLHRVDREGVIATRQSERQPGRLQPPRLRPGGGDQFHRRQAGGEQGDAAPDGDQPGHHPAGGGSTRPAEQDGPRPDPERHRQVVSLLRMPDQDHRRQATGQRQGGPPAPAARPDQGVECPGDTSRPPRRAGNVPRKFAPGRKATERSSRRRPPLRIHQCPASGRADASRRSPRADVRR